MDGALRMIPYLFVIFAIAGITAGATALSLSKFSDTTTDDNALAAIGNATKGVGDMAAQLPTVAIISIMVIIISILVGAFAVTRMFA